MRGLRSTGRIDADSFTGIHGVEGLCSFPLKEISATREVDIFDQAG